MTAILYPVAANAEQALSRPAGYAARQSDASHIAGEPVGFTGDPVGAAFPTREAALKAYSARLDAAESQDRYCQLVEQVAFESGRPPRPVEPTFEDGRRWPKPPPPPTTAWRLTVSYWRVGTVARPLEPPQARQVRRAGKPLEPETLRAITRAPLRSVKPQQPLDIGLFETRPPEAPHIVMPDE